MEIQEDTCRNGGNCLLYRLVKMAVILPVIRHCFFLFFSFFFTFAREVKERSNPNSNDITSHLCNLGTKIFPTGHNAMLGQGKFADIYTHILAHVPLKCEWKLSSTNFIKITTLQKVENFLKTIRVCTKTSSGTQY